MTAYFTWQFQSASDPGSLFLLASIAFDLGTDVDEAHVTVIGVDGTNVYTADFPHAACTSNAWHAFYMSFDGTDITIKLDATTLVSEPLGLTFPTDTWDALVAPQSSNASYRVMARYANIAQPPVAQQAATFNGPL